MYDSALGLTTEQLRNTEGQINADIAQLRHLWAGFRETLDVLQRAQQAHGTSMELLERLAAAQRQGAPIGPRR